MRIDSISIKNVIGARSIDAKLSTPVSLFCGGNGAGKSSIAEAVRMALTGDVLRVALKKEYPAIVTEGAKAGYAGVLTEAGEYGLDLPGGKGVSIEDVPALPFVLEPSRFASITADERRTFLFGLAGVKIDGAEVMRRLKDRGCTEALCAKVLPMLRSGFPAAAKFAADEAKDAKGAWRGVTGETYGAVKAEIWVPAMQPCDSNRMAALASDIEKLQLRIQAHTKSLGALEEKRRAYADHQKRADEIQSTAGKLASLQAKLKHDEAELAKWVAEVESLQADAGVGTRVGLVHDLARALKWSSDRLPESLADLAPSEVEKIETALAGYETQYGAINAEGDPEAAVKLPKAIEARDLMARAVANTKRDIAASEAAAAFELAAAPEPVEQPDIGAVRDALANVQADFKAASLERKELETAAQANEQAARRQVDAARHHAEVQAWSAIADALAPDGIPGELLASALKPINDRLRDSAGATGWMQVTIGADMTITAAGRPYRLLSESEQWRTDAMLAESISHLSGLKLLMLDRMDVLELGARGDLLGWLADLADAGELDTALVFATLKAPPTGLPDTIAPIWIERGEISNPQLQRAAV